LPGIVINRGERKDGSTKWRARWHHPDDGTIIVEKTYRDKRVAESEMRKWDRAAHDGMLRPVDGRKTFTELVEVWRQARYASFAPRTSARYDSVLRAHLTPEFGSKRVAAIDRAAVRQYFGRLAQRVADGEMTGGNVHKIATTLSSIMSEAVELGWAQANPCSRARGLPSSKPTRRAVFLTRDEITSLIDATDPRHQLLIRFAAYTGLRQSELFALRRRHVDELHGRVRVEDAIKEWKAGQPREPVFGETKSGKGRTVGLEPALRQQLSDHLAQLPGGPDAIIFTNDAGRPIESVSWMRLYFRPAVKRALAGRHVTFHDLRHSCASMLIASGANALEIKEWMGHASIQTTYDVYGHLFEDNVDDLASRLSAGRNLIELPQTGEA
jgi:integrase